MTKINHIQFMTLYKRGLLDTTIASCLNVSRERIRQIRNDYGLPKNTKMKFSPNLKQIEKVKILFKKGLNDEEIADKLNLDARKIMLIRYQQKIFRPKPKTGLRPETQETIQKMILLRSQKLSLKEIAEKLHFTQPYVSYIVKLYGPEALRFRLVNDNGCVRKVQLRYKPTRE